MSTKEHNISSANPVRSIDLVDTDSIHGVTCDAQGNVWYATGNGELNCLDASDGRILKQFYFEGAKSGTAFDGSHIWQITDDNIIRIDIDSGAIVETIELPQATDCSGMAYLDGALWIGDFRARKLVQLDIESGKVIKTLESDRFVTGVEWIDGQLWHGAMERSESPVNSTLRMIDSDSGKVREEIDFPEEWNVSGTGVDGDGRIWCGVGAVGGLRAIRRPEPQ